MTTEFPDEPLDGFPAPPRTVTDKSDREVTLRRAEPGDMEPLTEMYVDFDPEDRAQGIPPGSESAIREWLEVVMAEDTLNVLATHEVTPVGHVMLVPDRQGAYELAIFVLQEYQGAHIGTELVRTALGLAGQEDIEYIWLTVERWNTPAIALYEKIGFERTTDDSFEIEMSLRLATD